MHIKNQNSKQDAQKHSYGDPESIKWVMRYEKENS